MNMNEIKDGTEVAKSCPNCGPATNLVIRTNRKNNSRFLGCPNWPECTHTESIPESIKMRLAEQPALF